MIYPALCNSPVFTTFATRNFIPALKLWLTYTEKQSKRFDDAIVIVFLGQDVSANTISDLRANYNFAKFTHVAYNWTPYNFPDFWNPAHYAFKIWILQFLANYTPFKNRLILYTDAGSVLVSLPVAWMKLTAQHDVVCLDDNTQQNYQWCTDKFCEELATTDAELQANQIWAGSICFVGGAPKAISLFSNAFKYACMPHVICGPRLSGVYFNGRPYGHRHDQSILSILTQRHSIHKYPLYNIYCDTSLDDTINNGKFIYCHRGALSA